MDGYGHNSERVGGSAKKKFSDPDSKQNPISIPQARNRL